MDVVGKARGKPASRIIVHELMNNHRGKWNENHPFVEFIYGCLSWEPSERLTPKDGIQNVWTCDDVRPKWDVVAKVGRR